MNCRKMKDIISERPKRSSDMSYPPGADEHLKYCGRCRSLVEAEAIIEKIASDNKRSQPDEIYWNSLLPRIHMRIERKKESVVPSWVYRSFAPAAAAVLLVALSVSLLKFNTHEADILPAGLSENEISSYIEQKSVIDSYMSNLNGNGDAIGSDDAAVMCDLLRNESNIASFYEDKAGSILETVNEEEAEQLFALLSVDLENK